MKRLFALIIVCAFVTVGCKGPGDTASTGGGKPRKGELTEAQRMHATSMFHDANKEKILGNFEEAAKLYQKVLELDPESHASMFELASILDYLGETTTSLALAEKAVSLQSKNPWYRRLLAGVLTHQNKFDEAAEQFKTLHKQDPSHIDDYYDWAAVLTYGKNFDEAIKVYEMLQEQVGMDPQLSMEKHRLYMQMNKPEEAAEELEKYLLFDKSNLDVMGILAELYKKTAQPEKAMEVYERIRKIDPENGMVHLALADHYENQGDRAKSQEELRLAFASPNLDIDTKAQILLSYYGTSEVNKEVLPFAYELANIFVKTHPEDARPYSVLADFQYRDRKNKEARDNYKMAVKYDPSRFVIWNQILVIDAEMGDFADMVPVSAEAMELFPAQPSFYLFQGIGLMRKKDYDGAVEALEGGLPLVFDNQGLRMQFYSNLGDAYHALEEHEKSDKAYDQALAIDPNNTFVLNNYAYYLSLRNTKLEKAAEMSRRSNELQPGSASFQDTYGWILFMQGKYSEAEEWIGKALKQSPKSGEILEHYGDVLFRLNRVDEAVEHWTKAKAAGGASENIDKKIAERKLYE